MKINRENYEMIMFDLLEGNIHTSERNDLLEQIYADEFLMNEWKLFQYTVLITDKEFEYPYKSKLLKHIGNTRIFNMYFVSSIAASLLIFAIFYLFLYKPQSKSLVNKYESIKETHKSIAEKNISKLAIKNPKINIEVKEKIETQNASIISKNKDTTQIVSESKNYDEILIIGKNHEKIGYSFLADSIIKESEILKIYKYQIKKRSKLDVLMANTIKVRNIWDDLPNLKLHIKPKIKNYRPTIDITIKGEIIYANALIEIK